jgi:hypothetical protein
METNRVASRMNESLISADFEIVEFIQEQEKEEIKFVDPYDWHWLRIITIGVYFVELMASGELSLLYLALEFSSLLRKKNGIWRNRFVCTILFHLGIMIAFVVFETRGLAGHFRTLINQLLSFLYGAVCVEFNTFYS